MKPTHLNKVHTNNPNQPSGRNHGLEGSLHHDLETFCYSYHYHLNHLLILFLIPGSNSTVPAPINHGLQNEVKARNSYCSQTGFVIRTCGLVVNPSLPWLGASPDGLVEDPSQKCFGLLEIKCPYIHRFSTVQEACSDPSFFATVRNDKVTLKQEHKHFFQILLWLWLLWLKYLVKAEPAYQKAL